MKNFAEETKVNNLMTDYLKTEIILGTQIGLRSSYQTLKAAEEDRRQDQERD